MAHDQEAPPDGEVPRLGAFIRRRRAALLTEWELEMHRLPKAQALGHVRRVDHIPQILDRIAEVADAEGTELELRLAEAPDQHAVERLDEGYDLSEVVLEYRALRRVVLRHWQREVVQGVHPDDLVALDEAFDQAIAASVDRYTHARTRTLQALDRISEAALDEAEPERLLRRLLRVLMETTATVDSVTVMLRKGDELHVRETIGLEEEVARRFTVRIGEGFVGSIAAERRPRELRHAAVDPSVVSPAVRSRGVRGLYGVPMLLGSELIGVAHIGSTSAWEFSSEDKTLFRTMVSRATALLVQADLAEREQSARLEALDLAERERAARLRAEASEAELRVLADSIPQLVWSADESAAMHTCNGALLRYTGAAAETLMGHLWLDVVHPDDRADSVARWQRAIATGERYEVEQRVRRHDGAYRWFLVRGEPVRDASGRLVRWSGTSTDIDDLKRAEAERDELLGREQRARAEIAELLAVGERERQLLLAVLAQVPAGVVIAEAGTERLLFTNDAANRIWGGPDSASTLGNYRPGRVRRPDGSLLPPEELPIVRALRRGDEVREELRIARHDGSDGYVVAQAAPVRDGAGRVVAGVVAFMDLTDRRRDEEELRREAIYRDLFIGILGHDLRNPLAAITSGATLLLRRASLPPPTESVLRRMETSALRMQRLIDDLLDFTRVRAGGPLPLRLGPANLCDVVQRAVDELAVANPGRAVDLECLSDGRAICDAERVAQAVSNVVGNALQHSAPGAKVVVRVRGDEEAVLLEVENRGRPIPAELLPRLFDPFFRAGHETVGAAGRGLGLGLFIVQQIVAAHGGAIAVRSTEEDGTRFTIRWPRQPAAATPAP